MKGGVMITFLHGSHKHRRIFEIFSKGERGGGWEDHHEQAPQVSQVKVSKKIFVTLMCSTTNITNYNHDHRNTNNDSG